MGIFTTAFSSYLTNGSNKLECLLPTSFPNLVKCFTAGDTHWYLWIQLVQVIAFKYDMIYIKELLLKGKAQYTWPPYTNYLRTATFDNAKIIYFFTKQGTLMRRATALSLSVQLIFPVHLRLLLAIQNWCQCYKTFFFVACARQNKLERLS